MSNMKDLLDLLKGEFSALSINYNKHACNHDHSPEAIDEFYGDVDWASQAEKEKAYREKTIWLIQYHPNSSVGSFDMAASTFEAAANAILEAANV